ncbi:MAG: helix-turn-helix transcriptional regulator [Bacilli bacterium]|nr:helix-turn-helix transcriptional regulator [Bacilli bacterium]
MDQIKIGKFIAECRNIKKITQDELAQKLNITDKAVSKWENGRCMPDIQLLEPLCNELDITIYDLIQGKKLTVEEQKECSNKNVFSILTTKKELENMQILTELLIFSALIITGILTKLLAITVLQRIVTITAGIFIFGFGIFLRIKLRNIKNKIIDNN